MAERLFITIWLFAGNFLFVCPNNVGGKIKQMYPNLFQSLRIEEQSAGNLQMTGFKYEDDGVADNTPSEHLPKHKKAISDTDLGYYLAGLIEGDGYIGKRGFEIVFFEDDVSNAYYLKKRVGYGSISKVKDKKPYKLSIFHSKGVEYVWSLVNGKFQGPYKIAQAKQYGYDLKFNSTILPQDNSSILNTYWLAGFADADGNFSIFIAKSKTHKLGKNVTIPFRISQKHPDLIIKIRDAFGGGTLLQTSPESCNTHRYSTVTFCSTPFHPFRGGKGVERAIQVAKYFDYYHLMNNNQWMRYLCWKKALMIIHKKEHLTEEGLNKIENLKHKINTRNWDSPS